MDLARIQEEIRNQKLDGWLFFDHHLRDPLAYRVLGIHVTKGPSRRWYYMIPAEGEPIGMEHRIERNQLAAVPGEKIAYSTWSEQREALTRLVAGKKRVAMQYSPMCAVPYVSNVDAGTVELVRGLGVEVATSANLIQYFESRWTRDQLDSHLEAGRKVDKVRGEAFDRRESQRSLRDRRSFLPSGRDHRSASLRSTLCSSPKHALQIAIQRLILAAPA